MKRFSRPAAPPYVLPMPEVDQAVQNSTAPDPVPSAATYSDAPSGPVWLETIDVSTAGVRISRFARKFKSISDDDLRPLTGFPK